jgi:hypothetical protein
MQVGLGHQYPWTPLVISTYYLIVVFFLGKYLIVVKNCKYELSKEKKSVVVPATIIQLVGTHILYIKVEVQSSTLYLFTLNASNNPKFDHKICKI